MAGVYRSEKRFSTEQKSSVRQAAWCLCLAASVVALLIPPLAAQQSLQYDHYRTVEEFAEALQELASRHPAFTRVLEIGRSREGRAILAFEINNPETGRRQDKPGFYVDGNIHGGEVLGGEAALYFIDRLLSGYQRDAQIRQLVDSISIFVVPLVNPDGRAISVDTPENHRWNIRPVDEDGDGLLDEDPPEDLDGDGRILRMRIPDPEGEWQADPQDPRRMVREGGTAGAQTYRMVSEGIDNDLDGSFNEDRVGGVDLNRNFPANWHPGQFASGPYPLSEPESRALVDYITSRPEIAAIHTFHTSGGLILRFPTLADQNWDYPQQDLEAYRAIAEDGVAITGYENYAYGKQEIVDLMNPGHGVFNDWGSKVFGVLAITTEMWKHAFGEGQDALFEWNDQVLQGKGFIDWYPYEHPQLGPVELGGWDRWSTSSPPFELIRDELDRNVRWVLTFAEKVPRVSILSLEATRLGGSRRFRVQAQVANTGWMATATDYARDVLKIAKPVEAILRPGAAQLISGSARKSLGVLPGTRNQRPDVQSIEWEVELPNGTDSVPISLTIWSEKAGVVTRTVELR